MQQILVFSSIFSFFFKNIWVEIVRLMTENKDESEGTRDRKTVNFLALGKAEMENIKCHKVS